ncbi:MAG: hypothetical protein IJA43_00150 [Clostridia bacterium]|nr:hypothetical protein [Clostridia bacterium]
MDEKLNNQSVETEEKADISHLANRMFDENVVCEEEKPFGREYFDAVHYGELKPNTDHIVMTRSMYNKSVIKIEENTKAEIKEAKKYIPIYVIIEILLFILTVAINTVCHNIGLEPLIRLSGGVSAAALMILPALIYLFTAATVKRIKRAKTAREKALQRLEQTKQECMMMGTYDALK